jgi:hypothetical protein
LYDNIHNIFFDFIPFYSKLILTRITSNSKLIIIYIIYEG